MSRHQFCRRAMQHPPKGRYAPSAIVVVLLLLAATGAFAQTSGGTSGSGGSATGGLGGTGTASPGAGSSGASSIPGGRPAVPMPGQSSTLPPNNGTGQS